MSRSLKFLFIIAFLGLSAFYLYVLYLAKHPSVSMAYRMYYLEQKTRIWDRNQTLGYIPGVVMDLTKYRQRCPYLSREGWDIPHENGSGTDFSGKGGLYFTLHSLPGKLELIGNVSAAQANTTLSFSAGNWQQSVHFDKAGAQSFQVEIPAGVFISDPEKTNFLSLNSNNPLIFQTIKMSHAG